MRSEIRRLVAVAAWFVLATVVMTWPVAQHLGDRLYAPDAFIGKGAMPTPPDTYLHLWILAWVHHALTTAPTTIFDANVMYPARLALAGSEHMLGYWPLHAPVYALSGNPVLAYQWVLFSSFVLNGVALFALVRRWTGSGAAGLLGGTIYAFAPLRFELLGTVQHLNVAFLPLVLLAADRYRTMGRGRDLIAIGMLVGLQSLCSYYLAYATAVAIGVIWLSAVWPGCRWSLRRALAIGGMLVAGFVPLALLSLPYLALRAAASIPAYPEAWLRAAAATPVWFVRRGTPLFAGYFALGLALGGIVAPGLAWRRGVTFGLALTGVLLVLGPAVTVLGREVPLPYQMLYHWLPGFSALRYPYRFGVLVVLAQALLAGGAWAWLVDGRRRAAAWALTGLAIAVVCAEYFRAPIGLVPVEVGRAVPPVYGWLAEHGERRPLLEWPVAPANDIRSSYQNVRAMYFSTYHWLPLLNGYTAYEPPSYRLLLQLATRLPDARAAHDLVDLSGVRLLLLHRDRYPPAVLAQWTEWMAAGGCTPLVEFGADVVCSLPPPRRDLRARLVAANTEPPEETFAGLSLSPLAAAARFGRVVIQEPPRAVMAGLPTAVFVEVTNLGNAPWPGLAPLVPGVIAVRHRWRAAGERGVETAGRATPLLCDLEPGSACRLSLPVIPPRDAGTYDLEVSLGQEGGETFQLDAGPARMSVRVLAAGAR